MVPRRLPERADGAAPFLYCAPDGSGMDPRYSTVSRRGNATTAIQA